MASSSSSSPELSAAASASSDHESAAVQYSGLSREEVLEDLSSRFILNLPEEELASVERVCFQVEQAHWYYEDFVREQHPAKFPSYTLKTFSEALFRACPLLAHWAESHDRAFESFMKYKTRVPVCGAIMLNDTLDKCVLVKGWKSSAGWGFPKGKINEQEPEFRCAIREVLEETGYNLEEQLDPRDVIRMSIREQSISLYVVPGVPEDFPFETKTRKEISKIDWFRLTDLPTWKRNKTVPGKFYLISPFINPLKKFIRERKSRHFTPRANRPPVQDMKEEVHYSSEEDSTLVNDQSSVGNAQELSSQASSAEPQTPSPQYSAARVHMATFDANIGSATPDPARQVPNLEAENSHLANLLSGLQRSAASLSVDDPPKPQALPPQTMPKLVPPATQARSSVPPNESPDWSVHVPATLSVPVARIPQAHSTPALSPPSRESASSHPGSSPVVASTTSPSLRAAPVGAGHGRRSSAATADISPYLSHSRNINKEMRYISILESVAQESDRATSRMGHRSPMVAPNPAAYAPLPPPSVPVPPYRPLDRSVIYSSTPAGLPAMHRPPVEQPTYQTHHAPDMFIGRPRTSHAHHHIPYGPAAVPRQSMNEHQLRALLPLNGPWNGAAPVSPYPPAQHHITPTSPSRVAPPPFRAPHIAHNNSVRAANNAQLLSILNTPNPVFRA